MTAPVPPTPTETPLDVIARGIEYFEDTHFMAREWGADSALATVRALVDAALALDAYSVEGDAAGWPDWDARFEALEAATRQYRAWAPSPDAGTSAGGGA